LKAELRNAIRLGIKEARLERCRRNELASKLDDQIARLAADQLNYGRALTGVSLGVYVR
jgi:hypothetical protein